MASLEDRTCRQNLVRQFPEDLVADGLDRIEILPGRRLRFVFYIAADQDGRGARVPTRCDLIMPLASIPDAIGKTMLAIGRQVFVKPDGSITLVP
jgi:hypothetical protein